MVHSSYASDAYEDIVCDFKQVSAYIVGKEGDCFIIDVGIDKDINVGDIFSLVDKKTIIHPKTKQEMTYSVVVSHLKVIGIKDNYSLAESLGDNLNQAAIGSEVVRYEHVPSTFFDLTGKSKHIYLYLKEHLPFLKWEGYQYIENANNGVFTKVSDKSRVCLAFIGYDDKIEVYSGDNDLINIYSHANGLPKAGGDLNKESTVDAKDREAVLGNTVTYDKLRRIDSFPFYTKMSDFLKINGELYLAAINDKRIRVINVNDRDALNIEVDVPDNNEGLTVQWLHVEENDDLYIIINTWSRLHNRVVSYLSKINGDKITILDSSNAIIGAFDDNSDGRRTFILGQEYDPEEFYGKRIRKYNINSDRLHQGEYTYDFPAKFRVLGSAISDVTGDGVNENIFIRNNILYIYSGKDLIYTSSKVIGNNASMLTYEINPKSPYVRQNTVSIELPPVTEDVDGDGTSELLVIASKRNELSSVVGVSEIENNWIVSFKYKDEQFIKGSIERVIDEHIKGFTVADSNIVAVVSAKKGLLEDVKETTDIVDFDL
jgi:hypothetical protein